MTATVDALVSISAEAIRKTGASKAEIYQAIQTELKSHGVEIPSWQSARDRKVNEGKLKVVVAALRKESLPYLKQMELADQMSLTPEGQMAGEIASLGLVIIGLALVSKIRYNKESGIILDGGLPDLAKVLRSLPRFWK